MGKEGRRVGQKSLCSGEISVRPVGNLRAENFHWETPAWGWWSGLMSLQAQLWTWSSLGRAWPWHEHLSGSQRLATIYVLPSRFLSWRNIWAVHIHGCHSPLFGPHAPEPALPQYISRPYLISWFPFSSIFYPSPLASTSEGLDDLPHCGETQPSDWSRVVSASGNHTLPRLFVVMIG